MTLKSDAAVSVHEAVMAQSRLLQLYRLRGGVDVLRDAVAYQLRENKIKQPHNLLSIAESTLAREKRSLSRAKTFAISLEKHSSLLSMAQGTNRSALPKEIRPDEIISDHGFLFFPKNWFKSIRAVRWNLDFDEACLEEARVNKYLTAAITMYKESGGSPGFLYPATFHSINILDLYSLLSPDPETTRNITRYLVLFWLMSNQKFAVKSRVELGPRTVRIAEEAGMINPEATFIELRVHTYEAEIPPPGTREFSYQHEVRSHWVNQACGPGWQDHKWIWVESYIRGPKDRLLIITPKRFILDR